MNFFKSMFSGGIVQSIENIAKEWITTDMESAEARALMVKTLDPNGKMRRDLSRFACRAYGFYLVVTVGLIFMSVWAVGGDQCNTVGTITTCISRAEIAAGMMKDLFLPITGAWTAIVSASFGVNGINSFKGRP